MNAFNDELPARKHLPSTGALLMMPLTQFSGRGTMRANPKTNLFWKGCLIFGTWTSLALVGAGSRYVRALASGSRASFVELVKPFLHEYWIWAVLTPLVLFVARLLPFTKGRRLMSAFGHCLGCLLFCVFHVVIIHVLRLNEFLPLGFHGPALVGGFIVNFYSDIWMYWPIVGLWNLVEYYRKFRERETRAAQLETQLARAELNALRNQLHPHFLFNTLNSISALIQDDPEAAEDMLSDLSDMLRTTLDGSNQLEIPLAQELEMLAAYLRIQSRRFSDKLLVRINADLETRIALVPTLILQPIVENAVRHGIAPLSRPGLVEVRAFRAGDRLTLVISDDGQGLPASYTEGIGLTNTRERLRQHYGERQKLQIESTYAHGVCVLIEIPFREAEHSPNGEESENPRDDRRRRTVGASSTSVVDR